MFMTSFPPLRVRVPPQGEEVTPSQAPTVTSEGFREGVVPSKKFIARAFLWQPCIEGQDFQKKKVKDPVITFHMLT